jgi:hypothetical protein
MAYLHSISPLAGGLQTGDGGSYVFLAFKMIDKINPEDSVGPRGAFDLLLGQPSDESSLTQISGGSIPSFKHSSDTNSDNDASLNSKERKEVSKEVSTGFEDDNAAIATRLDNTNDSFNRVAFSMPHPVLSKNPLPKSTKERTAMTATIRSAEVARKAEAAKMVV